MTGIDLRLVGPNRKASEMSLPCGDNSLCQRVQSVEQGCRQCRRFVEELVIETQNERLASSQCDAGLTGFCLPLRLHGEILGYLLAGGYRTGSLDITTRNRLRHLLGRMKIPDESAALREYETSTVTMDNQQEAAIHRWLQLAADALIRSLELRHEDNDRPMPNFVVKICAVIQREYMDPPSQPEAARICALSEGYFSRAFHQHTGLRYVEYIHAVRIEHVCDLLMNPDCSITEAAFTVGFQSLSQFNRVFRKQKGMPPRQWRRQHHAQSPPLYQVALNAK